MEFIGWMRAYPSLNGRLEKTIWWTVFKQYWIWPLGRGLARKAIWHAFFHFIFKLANI
jgi:hypothetical protein